MRCLTERKEDIKSDTCQQEVLYFEKMEVSNFNNDVILAAACRGDVQKFCSDVQSGQAITLRGHSGNYVALRSLPDISQGSGMLRGREW